MLLPHIPRHTARYLGTREAGTGAPVTLGRLAEPGACTLWLDEGGIHFQRPDESGPFLLPRRCLLRAGVCRSLFRSVVDVWWTGAGGMEWVSRFSARRGDDWKSAVERLRDATIQWETEAQGKTHPPLA